ncbi:hypothetical protein SAMN05216289_1133 [Dokdonella immobilis]|uniref:Uncharacterized protein n=1 Tax=Dokdonella immobilis TaxID=578942 RepID=A0A1I4XWR7_9GAMM|nr:hypothetical protein SAMN05216289_1133 [Dokdonella immobilis]
MSRSTQTRTHRSNRVLIERAGRREVQREMKHPPSSGIICPCFHSLAASQFLLLAWPLQHCIGAAFTAHPAQPGRSRLPQACRLPITAAPALPSLATREKVPAGRMRGFGLWALGFGLWALGFGLWALGFGLWALGFGLWALGFGLWALAVAIALRSGAQDARYPGPVSGGGRAKERPAGWAQGIAPSSLPAHGGAVSEPPQPGREVAGQDARRPPLWGGLLFAYFLLATQEKVGRSPQASESSGLDRHISRRVAMSSRATSTVTGSLPEQGRQPTRLNRSESASRLKALLQWKRSDSHAGGE